jgi:hypothetical protein
MEMTVVTLRQCSRGGPMLPMSCSAAGWVEAWEPVKRGSRAFALPLAEYLREFLRRLGAQTLPIHSTLKGWHLPPYQAAVRSDHWQQLWRVLEVPFRDMRTAYRYHVGGSAAPSLSTACEPRFKAPVDPSALDVDTTKSVASDASTNADGASDIDASSSCSGREEWMDSCAATGQGDRLRTSPSTRPEVRNTFLHWKEPSASKLRRVSSEPCLGRSANLSKAQYLVTL